MHRNLGCRMGGGVVKVVGSGGIGETPWFLFCLEKEYLTRYMLVTWVCGLELVIPYLFCQNSCENRKFLRFLVKSRFLLTLCILSVIVNISKISREHLHYDVIVTSYEDEWYFLVPIERGDPWLYIGSKHTGIGRLI